MPDEKTFETLADRTLARIATLLEDERDDVDVELVGGVLTVELDDGRQYVINRHGPNRQIWLSSPVSGAWHFNPADGGGWTATRGGGSLAELLAREFGIAVD
jgi:frataxin